jgi:hypothetical protein
MRRILALGIGLATAVLAPHIVRAADGPSDGICTEATAPMRAYSDKAKNPNTSLDEATELAQKVVDAYDACAADKLSRGQVENLQYAHLWAARYEYVVGGWQHLGENDGLAKVAYDRAIKLCQDIIDWHPDSQNWYASNDVNVGSGSSHNSYANGYSKFRQDAIEVRDAANKAIALLKKPTAAAAPAPAPTGK